MKLRVVSKAQFKSFPSVCEKCKVTVKIGEQYYVANPSKRKYCKPCGDKMYQ